MLLIGESDVAIHASDSLIGQVSLALLHTTKAAPRLPVSSLASRASMDLICSISFLSAQAQGVGSRFRANKNPEYEKIRFLGLPAVDERASLRFAFCTGIADHPMRLRQRRHDSAFQSADAAQ